MKDEAAYLFTAAMAFAAAVIGLFMWAAATDTGIAVFGFGLLAFGLAFLVGLLKAWCDLMEPVWGKGERR